MTFSLPEDQPDLAAALRDLEPQAPKHIRPFMIKAATQLDDYRRLCADAALELDHAASLHLGVMDSTSRTEEITQAMRLTMTTLATRMRETLTKP